MLVFLDLGVAERTSRGFKSLKQMTKMNYLHLKRPNEALQTYRELLGYTKVSSVWRRIYTRG